ncbi:MAG TPA: S41 family peptidase [Spirochaetia bacterium]|nr:S41 family peptidase [Spirochaetia bacterium]
MHAMSRGRPHAPVVLLVLAFILSPLAVFADNPPSNAPAASSTDTTDYVQLLQQVFQSVQDNYVDKVDAKKLFEGAMKGLFDTLGDPHSYYLTQDQLKDLTDTTRGRFGGVGLIISKPAAAAAAGGQETVAIQGIQPEPAYVEVVSPIQGTPAFKAGISAGDRISKIENESTIPMSIDDVVNKLRGIPGTAVTVTIVRGSGITFTTTLDRAIIEVPVVRFAMIPDNIGYLRIIQYTPLTPSKVRDAVEALAKQGAKSLIIDERGNPGGLLSAVVRTSDFFLSAGTIVSTRSPIPAENAVYAATASTLVPAALPIIVLIDKGSASAAEIFAGALKDHDRALLVGETSYGKGSVQQVFFLKDGDGAFKLTTARYYTPDGVNIDKIGIKPDVAVNEPQLSQPEQDSLKKLLEENIVTTYVRENPNADDSDIAAFTSKLQKDGFKLGQSTLLQLVHSEQDRMQNDPPVYDLRYDKILTEAVSLLQSGQYPKKPQ